VVTARRTQDRAAPLRAQKQLAPLAKLRRPRDRRAVLSRPKPIFKSMSERLIFAVFSPLLETTLRDDAVRNDGESPLVALIWSSDLLISG
jgi:hypothetical protein